jgi:cell division protein FtsB
MGIERNRKASRELAKQAFLYGEGDGKPVLDIHRLIEISGLHPATIKRHMDEWTAEREEMLINKGNCGLALHLSGKTIKDHHADVAFLREQADKLKSEVANLEKAENLLLTILENMADSLDLGPDDADKLISLADKYFKILGSKKSLITLSLAVQKRWQESSGIASTMKAWETGQREQEKGLARVEAKKKELELLKDGSLEVVSTPALGVFARKKNASQPKG